MKSASLQQQPISDVVIFLQAPISIFPTQRSRSRYLSPCREAETHLALKIRGAVRSLGMNPRGVSPPTLEAPVAKLQVRLGVCPAEILQASQFAPPIRQKRVFNNIQPHSFSIFAPESKFQTKVIPNASTNKYSQFLHPISFATSRAQRPNLYHGA